jgi:hypothetical protein
MHCRESINKYADLYEVTDADEAQCLIKSCNIKSS